MTQPRFVALAASLLFVLVFAIATTPVETAQATAPARKAPAAKQQTSPPAAQAGAQSGYVGEATCVTCHDQSYKGTKHALAFNDRTPAATHGCESCHGPGQKHAESGDPDLILRFSKMKPEAVSATCMTCHGRTASHALWDGSPHDQRSLSCVTCHSVHSSKGPSQLKAQTVSDQCATCHRNIVNKENRFHHMPVREGALTCASCHNVHGSTNVKLLRAGTTIDESCTSCHADKRGPYLWEHAPVTESCVTCHDPHGSNNDRMLVSKLPFLCQRCHVTSRHPPTVYDGFQLNNTQNANKIFGRGCTNCHQMVHGSNSPSGKALLR